MEILKQGSVKWLLGKLKTALANKLSLGGGTLTGKLYIKNNLGNVGGATSIELNGAVKSGSDSTAIYTGFFNTRKCSADSNAVNHAGFFVNSDGTAKFVHRRGSSSNFADDAYILFDATGFQIAYSGTKGTKATVNYKIYDSHNLDISQFATKAEIQALEERIAKLGG